MAYENEKFFERLAGINPQEPDVELARAKAGSVASRPAAPPRKVEEEIRNESEGWLTIDVYQTPTEIVVESAVAGVRPEDLDITVTPDSVSIKGERTRNEEARTEDYLYQECYWGRFSRSVILPQEIDPDNASVSFKNGILSVRLPKVSHQKTKKLKVRVE